MSYNVHSVSIQHITLDHESLLILPGMGTRKIGGCTPLFDRKWLVAVAAV